MPKQLDINAFEKGRPIIIGEMTADLLALIKANSQQPIVSVLTESPITMWEDRIPYTEKHIPDFPSRADFDEAVANIPNIIENPDYIGIHPDGGSLQFIKRIGPLLFLAVKISPQGKLNYRTMYPITQGQLADYIKKNRAWPVP